MDALVNITARVMVGTKLAFNWGKLFKPEETVQSVVDKTITKAAQREERNLIFTSVEVYSTEDAMAGAGKSLDSASPLDSLVTRTSGGRFSKTCRRPGRSPTM